ncbi:TetR/AcrR family transcriptional regulator [Microbacterium aoyamense]|uniref:TetR/AcrR family transcriptional regulator n=1 Tax=Microbacterium aoyamense TaxID=344166 RepID=A0ABP5AT12_9MICO|nr:TetR/AcrR family transcriptional regulator [Microbacterium aoyamense]
MSSPAAGRPRDPDVDEAILRATADLLAAEGPTTMTLDAVARAAGCGKAAIYRRWNGKTELIVAAVQRLYRAPDVPDTGSLREDLLLCARHYSGRDERSARILAHVLLESKNDPALREAAAASVGRPPVQVLNRVLARAVERGILTADAPLELVATILPALAFRSLTTAGRALTDDEAVELVDRVLIPSLTAGS